MGVATVVGKGSCELALETLVLLLLLVSSVRQLGQLLVFRSHLTAAILPQEVLAKHLMVKVVFCYSYKTVVLATLHVVNLKLLFQLKMPSKEQRRKARRRKLTASSYYKKKNEALLAGSQEYHT